MSFEFLLSVNFTLSLHHHTIMNAPCIVRLIIFSNCVYIVSFTVWYKGCGLSPAACSRAYRGVNIGRIYALADVFSHIFLCCRKTDFKDEDDLDCSCTLWTSSCRTFTVGPPVQVKPHVFCFASFLKRRTLLCAATLFTIYHSCLWRSVMKVSKIFEDHEHAEMPLPDWCCWTREDLLQLS